MQLTYSISTINYVMNHSQDLTLVAGHLCDDSLKHTSDDIKLLRCHRNKVLQFLLIVHDIRSEYIWMNISSILRIDSTTMLHFFAVLNLTRLWKRGVGFMYTTYWRQPVLGSRNLGANELHQTLQREFFLGRSCKQHGCSACWTCIVSLQAF